MEERRESCDPFFRFVCQALPIETLIAMYQAYRDAENKSGAEEARAEDPNGFFAGEPRPVSQVEAAWTLVNICLGALENPSDPRWFLFSNEQAVAMIAFLRAVTKGDGWHTLDNLRATADSLEEALPVIVQRKATELTPV
jgi:hypothetical protein